MIEAAKATRRNAHAPYSNYHVGAALLTGSGAVVTGCNVENASYGATICAERMAIGQMVSRGEKDLRAVVVVTAGITPAPPCGMCRQVLVEFARDIPVILVAVDPTGGSSPDVRRDLSLATLFPEVFELPPTR
ncbi:MAG: cytidine deaminase [Polyangiaceae bacterium]